MKSIRFLAVATLAAGLAACGEAPEATIEKNCVRFEKDSSDKEKSKEMCACMAENLKENMSEDGLKKVAAAFKKAKDGDDLERTLEEEGVGDAEMMAFVSAAKSCSLDDL